MKGTELKAIFTKLQDKDIDDITFNSLADIVELSGELPEKKENFSIELEKQVLKVVETTVKDMFDAKNISEFKKARNRGAKILLQVALTEIYKNDINQLFQNRF